MSHINLAEPKVPPHSQEMEQGVLGSLMLLQSDDERFQSCIDTLDSSDFYRPDHRLLYSAIQTLAAQGQPHDFITITEQAKSLEILAKSGVGEEHMRQYVGTLAKDTPSAANIAAYAKGVKNASILRAAMLRLGELAQAASVPDFSDENVSGVVEQIAGFAFDLEQGMAASDKGMKPLKPALKQMLNDIQTSQESGSLLRGIETGYAGLDERLSGLEGGKLYIIAGRPSQGKTTLAQNITEHVAMTQTDQMAALFSLEMPIDQLAEKFTASAGRANFGHIRTPALLNTDDWTHISMGISKLKDANIMIADEGYLTPSMMKKKLRAEMHKSGLKPSVVVVDYIQLMSADPSRSSSSRNDEVSTISRALKAMAMEFNVPIIALSQLNRGVESRTNKRPIMSDLRDSGAIEQDADVIMFVYRDYVYAVNEQRDQDMTEDEKRRAEIIVAKGRGCKIGTEMLSFYGEYQRFDNYEPELETWQ